MQGKASGRFLNLTDILPSPANNNGSEMMCGQIALVPDLPSQNFKPDPNIYGVNIHTLKFDAHFIFNPLQ
jgi:hypothetical protein